MAIQEKYIGESSISTKPKKKLIFMLNNDSVGTQHLKNRAVTPEKLSESVTDALSEPILQKVMEELYNTFVSDTFGNSQTITVSQKLLTDTINDIYAKIRELNGEPPVGLYMTVTPEYFIGEEGADIHIEAISTSGLFEKVSFLIDGVQLEGAENRLVYRLAADTHIDDTSTVKCKATVLGIDYEIEKTITRYNSFWLGAGATYTDIMDVAHNIPFENRIRGAYNVTCQEGDHIIVIVGEHLKEGFIRADLNGFEIPFSTEKVSIGGNDYWVMTSENVYVAGTYNIDING